MDKVKAFVEKYKVYITAFVAAVFTFLAATGHVVPQGIVDFVNQIIAGL
jgi:hypothetical protein